MGAGGIFFLVFMLRAGVPVPVVLCAQAAIVALRFLMRPPCCRWPSGSGCGAP